MPWRSLLRTSGAVWGFMPVAAWMWLISRSPDFTFTVGYWEAATAQISYIGIFPVALCAAAGTWEAVRLKRSQIAADGGAAVRSPVAVMLQQLGVVGAVGMLCIAWALFCVAEGAKGAPGVPDFRVIALLAFLVCTYASLGYAVGWLLPGILAVPAVAVGTFLWLAYPVAMDPLWLRRLNGTNLDYCCAVDRTLDPRALQAPAIVALGLFVAALVIIGGRSAMSRLLALAPVAVACAVAVPLVMPMGYDPTRNRDVSALSCSSGTPRICLWPEQQHDASKFRMWLEEGTKRLKEAGVDLPETYTPSFVGPTRARVLASLVGSVMPKDAPSCAQKGAAWPGGRAGAPVATWLELTAGGRADDVAQRVLGDGGKTLSLVQQVRALPAEAQLNWYRTNRAALTDCVTQPQIDPSAYAGSAE
ncbi:hypothetical protein QFZ67_004618 [Streptomyces sp. V1I1]|nr:hypothetical protein [Streptomyces sp. V1I1]